MMMKGLTLAEVVDDRLAAIRARFGDEVMVSSVCSASLF